MINSLDSHDFNLILHSSKNSRNCQKASNIEPITIADVSIHEEFSNPANLETSGSVDRLLLGLVNQPCQRRDEFVIDEMTNHLFQTPAFAFGMDLASLNIQRGRDHGLPPYVRWREPCGLSPIKTFQDLDKVMSSNAARKFRSLYSAVEDIDLYSAGLAEKSVVGGLVGPTFACIIGQQFSNLRRGDRFWYENPESESSFTAGQLQQIRRVTLAQILCRTMDGIKTIQPFVFLAADTLKNQRLSCDDSAIKHLNLEFWAERPFEFKNTNELQKAKRATTNVNSDLLSMEDESANSRKSNNQQEQAKITPHKPFKNSINQNNRIVIKRPLGRPDNNNVTIVVQNNAVNTPVFINDGIYGSHIRIQPVIKRPIGNFSQAASYYPAHRPQQPKPIPTTVPHYTNNFHAFGYPYRPYAYDDPSNPNPLAYGYRSPISIRDDVFYDNYSASSPKPTLYTYYTNFQQKPSTTQLPDHKVDGYLINHQPPYHNSIPTHASERPKPINSGFFTISNNNQPQTQKPNYDESQPLSNTRPIHRPNYTSNNFAPFQEQKPDYSTVKPDFFSRPNNELYQKPTYATVSPMKPSVFSRPNNELYQKPTYAPVSPVKPDFSSRPNNELYQKPTYAPVSPANLLGSRPHKPLHQEQWNLNNYQQRPSERPYDQDNPNAYQRLNNQLSSHNTYNTNQTISINRPNNEYNSQSGKKSPNPTQNPLYGYVPNFGTTSTPYYEKGTTFKEPSNTSPASHDNYNRYSDTTPNYQKISTQSSLTSVSSYIKESSTRPSQSVESFNPHSTSFYQKPTSQPIYQKNDQSSFSLDDHISFVFYKDKDQSTPTSHWLDSSTTGFQLYRQQETPSQKPNKVQSVTIVTETIETVHHPGQSGYIPQHIITSEIPIKPLVQQIKNSMPVVKRPGQYYYEKNVLHRYPDEIVEQIPKSNRNLTDELKEIFVQDPMIIPEKIAIKTSIIDDPVTNSRVIQKDKSKLTTTSTIVINNYDSNGNETIDDSQRAFLEDVESVAVADTPDRYFLDSIV